MLAKDRNRNNSFRLTDAGFPVRSILAATLLFFYPPIAYSYGWMVLHGIHLDFPSYYYAAKFAFVEGQTPYGLNAFSAISAAIGQKVNPYFYPPPSLVLFWPLAALSRETAQVTFLVVSHGCYLGSVWLMLAKLAPVPIHRYVGDRHSGSRRVGNRRVWEITLCVSLVYLLCFDPVFATLGIGQINLIVLFLICLALAALKAESSPLYVALPLTAAILLKTYPALLLLPILFRKQFRIVAWSAAILGLFTAVSAFVLPPGVWSTWVLEILPLGGYADARIAAGFPWNQNLNGFVMRLFMDSGLSAPLLPEPSLAKPMITVLALAIAGVTIFFSHKLTRLEHSERFSDDEMAAYLLMIFLIAPLSWDHHLVYILPAALVVIARIVGGSVPTKVAVFLTVALALLAWKIPLDHAALRSGWPTLLISMKFYPAVLLWLFFISRLAKRLPAGKVRTQYNENVPSAYGN